MTTLFALFRALFQRSPHDPSTREEAYLAQAVDMCDLKRRIRDIEHGRSGLASTTPLGVFGY